jgi:hypothetical protein
MTESDPAAAARGDALVEELRWIHHLIRRDLGVLLDLAGAVRDGLPPFEASATLHGLALNGPLWQMRMNCVRWCHFVEGHHYGETEHWFPELVRTNPALAPVVDKLNADHIVVAAHLEAVHAAGDALAELDTPEQRSRLVCALEDLSRDLLAHLAYEEEQVSPTLRTWTRWPHM